MMRWGLAMFVALVVLDALHPWLRRLGIGRLPGDVVVKIGSRVVRLPLMSALVLSAIFSVIAKLL